MSPRPRKSGNKDLPINLYPAVKNGVTYYQFRNPLDRKFYGMGTDKQEATLSANRLNNTIYKAKRKKREAKIIAEPKGMLMRDWLRRYWELVLERKLAKNTLLVRDNILSRIRKDLNKIPVKDVTVKHCADMINALRDEGKARMAQSVRSVLIDIFRDAMAEGITDTNPALITRNPKVEVKRSRLTLDDYKSIFEIAGQGTFDPWLQNSMLLAMTTGQRREDIALMKFSDIKDGFLHIKQNKTGTLLRLNLNIRLNVIDCSIGEAVKRCKDTVCPTLLHHTKRRTKSNIGEPIHKNSLSRRFANARDLAGIKGNSPPTFHEMRSLAAREYVKQGLDVQLLLGHKDPRMTDTYKDNRGAEWVEVNG